MPMGWYATNADTTQEREALFWTLASGHPNPILWQLACGYSYWQLTTTTRAEKEVNFRKECSVWSDELNGRIEWKDWRQVCQINKEYSGQIVSLYVSIYISTSSRLYYSLSFVLAAHKTILSVSVSISISISHINIDHQNINKSPAKSQIIR